MNVSMCGLILVSKEGMHTLYVCMYYTLNKALEYSVLEKTPAEQIAIELWHPRHDLLQEAARFIDNNCSIEIDNSVARGTDPSATTPTLREVSAALFTLVVGDGSRRPTLHMHRHSGLAQTSLLTPQQSSHLSVAEQMRDCMQQLSALLREYEVGMADAVFVHLYLSNISYFAAVNEEYCKWFGRHPPSRSCIAVNNNYQNAIFIYLYTMGIIGSMLLKKVPLSEGSDIALDAFVYKNSYRSISDPGTRQRKVRNMYLYSEMVYEMVRNSIIRLGSSCAKHVRVGAAMHRTICTSQRH